MRIFLCLQIFCIFFIFSSFFHLSQTHQMRARSQDATLQVQQSQRSIAPFGGDSRAKNVVCDDHSSALFTAPVTECRPTMVRLGVVCTALVGTCRQSTRVSARRRDGSVSYPWHRQGTVLLRCCTHNTDVEAKRGSVPWRCQGQMSSCFSAHWSRKTTRRGRKTTRHGVVRTTPAGYRRSRPVLYVKH